jgi:hypothetical protein
MVEWLGLFDKIKGPLRGSPFPNNDDLQRGVRESVRTIPKEWLLHPLGSYQKDGNGALTSVGSMCRVLKCDCVAVTSQPVFQASPNYFWTTLKPNYPT